MNLLLNIFLIFAGIFSVIIFIADDDHYLPYFLYGILCIGLVFAFPSRELEAEASDEQYITIQSLAKTNERARPAIKKALEDK